MDTVNETPINSKNSMADSTGNISTNVTGNNAGRNIRNVLLHESAIAETNEMAIVCPRCINDESTNNVEVGSVEDTQYIEMKHDIEMKETKV